MSSQTIQLHRRFNGQPLTEYDQIQVGQQAALGGKLQINLLDGFLPMVGDVFTFLIAGGGIVGDFSAVVLPELAGLAFQLNRDANSVSLLVSAAPIPVPASFWLLGTALAAGLSRRRRRC